VRRITFLCVSLFFFWSATLTGQTAVTTRSTNLRRDPSTKHANFARRETLVPLTDVCVTDATHWFESSSDVEPVCLGISPIEVAK
jgi:hypothetical protein